MAESEFYEKLSIRDSVKSLKKYGSTSRHTKRDENFVKHTVTSTDTLQGLALKYGVTVCIKSVCFYQYEFIISELLPRARFVVLIERFISL